ncbi:hypothetical protein RM61_01005 [Xanthomonas phaseoli pv. phaseoli]|nr:hypothetical protein RM61_01005 [Xanthomonas phaseoli pv. phaseoli]
MPAEPDAQPLLVVSLVALPVLAEMERSASATVTLPDCSSCWRSITCTGFGPSLSLRLMLEPVTLTVARVLPVAGVASSACASGISTDNTARDSR